MNLEGYDVIKSSDYFEYGFYSEGPKGRIKKRVRFQPFSNNAGNFFNLVFGDADETGVFIDDSVVSINHDAEGSSAGRNRLYRMAINRRLKEIKKSFNIFGVTEDNEIEPFIRRKNYVGFVAQRKFY